MGRRGICRSWVVLAVLGATVGASTGCSVPTGSPPAPNPAASAAPGPAPNAPPNSAQVGWVDSLCAVNTSFGDAMHDMSTYPPVTQTPTDQGIAVGWIADMFWSTAARMRDLHTRLDRLRPAPIPHGDDVLVSYQQAVDNAAKQLQSAADEAHSFVPALTNDNVQQIGSLWHTYKLQYASGRLPGPDLATDPAYSQAYVLAPSCQMPPAALTDPQSGTPSGPA